MTMTVANLHKKLTALIKQGHGRKPVCINKRTFGHPLEDDGCVILGIKAIKGPAFINNMDDDGGFKENADGTESGRMTVVLEGDDADESIA